MKVLRPFWISVGVVLALYILLPMVVFDFSSVAVPFDEDNYNGRMVAIGPRPRWWVPGAAHHLDIPGGFDYATSGWPFIVWKPLCLAYLNFRGYERPGAWR